MKIRVYKTYVELRYFNTFFSRATFFILILNILAITAPFLLAYYSNGFWMKRDAFYEQPDIKYNYEYVLIAETNKLNSPIFCTNIFDNENKINDFDYCSELKVREIDNNGDRQYDELNFSIILNNLQDIKISGITLILPLDYTLKIKCYVQMQTIALIQHFHSNPGTSMTYFGEISLSQTNPIPCVTHTIFDTYNRSVIKPQEYDLKSLFTEEYFTRNVTTRVQNTYISWTSGTGSTFDLNVHLKYPEHKIYYIPRFWQVIKFAWIQYLSIYILFSWFAHIIKDYVFSNRIVSYYIDSSSYNKIK